MFIISSRRTLKSSFPGSKTASITYPFLSFGRGIPCRAPASCSHPRTGADRHGEEAHDPRRSPGLASRPPDRRRTADAAAGTLPVPHATSGHIPGRQHHRAAGRRSQRCVPYSRPAPVRRIRRSRDSGRGVLVSWASCSPHSIRNPRSPS